MECNDGGDGISREREDNLADSISRIVFERNGGEGCGLTRFHGDPTEVDSPA